jgi:two-component system phosphate regulon sensor histidine kinase PhoR
LPSPALLIDGWRRIAAVNAPAQVVFGAASPGAFAEAALRVPEVLSAIADAGQGRTAQAALRVPGTPERHFAVHARPAGPPPAPLPTARAEDPPPRCPVLLVLEDLSEGRRLARARADFLANASHELRTPLAALSGFIETLRGHARNDPEAQERFLEIMFRQSQRMRRLIDDLMSLSRIEANEMRRPEGVIDLADTIRTVLEALAPVAAAARVELAAPEDTGPVWVRADADELAQVVQNLVDNAIKYGRAGTTVRVALLPDAAYAEAEPWAYRSNPAADRVVLLDPGALRTGRFTGLRVTDAGSGIERDHLPRLSERFYRVDPARSGLQRGTGLGLAIVKHVVARSRGAVLVESEPGAGSTFAVLLPRSPPPEPPSPAA